MHPSPEMLLTGARPPASVIGRAGWFSVDAACPIGPGSWSAIAAAAACALAAADEAAGNRDCYALCRPPGHHAYAARAGGHCYLNNAAQWQSSGCSSITARGALPCWTSTATTATAPKAFSGHATTFCSPRSTVTRQGYYPMVRRPRRRVGQRTPAPASIATSPLPPARAISAGSPPWTAASAGDRAVWRRCAGGELGLRRQSRDEPLNFLSVSLGRLRPRRRRHRPAGPAGGVHPGRRLQHRNPRPAAAIVPDRVRRMTRTGSP